MESLQIALGEKQQASLAAAANPGLAFVFSGQGTQWARMGMELIHYPVYRRCIESADAYFKHSAAHGLPFVGLAASTPLRTLLPQRLLRHTSNLQNLNR